VFRLSLERAIGCPALVGSSRDDNECCIRSTPVTAIPSRTGHLGQAFLFDRPDPSLCERIQIRDRGRPGYCRCLEPSNFWATSLRYHPKIVSGLATQATSRSAFAPTAFRFRPECEFLLPSRVLDCGCSRSNEREQRINELGDIGLTIRSRIRPTLPMQVSSSMGCAT
jgi:hypothetical protein